MLLTEQERASKKGMIVHSKVEFNKAAAEDPAHYQPFEAQRSVPLVFAITTQDGELCTPEGEELVQAKKALDTLFEKLCTEFPPLLPESPMKIP